MESSFPAAAGPIWSGCGYRGYVVSDDTRPPLVRGAAAGRDGPKTPPGPLAALLQRCAAGDEAAFRRVYDLQAPRLFGLALRLMRDRALAADVVHDAFCQVWQRAGSFDPRRGAAEAWLTGLVRFRAIDLLRKRARERTGVALREEADEAAGPLERLLATTAGQALHRCLARLEADQRQVIALAFMQGLSHTSLAERLGIPLGTVKSRIRRALAALKVCLAS